MIHAIVALFLVVLTLAWYTLIGLAVRKLFAKAAKSEFAVTPETAPALTLIGAAAAVCAIQTLNLIVPVRAVALLFIPLTVAAFFYCRGSLRETAIAFKSNRALLIISFLTAFITLLPFVRYGEAVALHFGNNDIAFYLSSMEWLRDYSFTEPIGFNSADPFNSLANYMLRNTRIGADMLGALALSFLPLESYEIFLPLCAVFSILGVFGATYLMRSTLRLSGSVTAAVTLFLGSGVAMIELTKQQYMPQILGIAFFVWFFACVYEFFFNGKRDLSHVLLLALSAIAVISVYSEYASYAVIVFLIAFATDAVAKRNIKSSLTDIADAFRMVIAAFIFNVSGFYIALKFNVDVILSQISTLENIDPYGGNITNLEKLASYVFNVYIERLGANISFGAFALPTAVSLLAYAVAAALLALGIFTVVRGVIRKHSRGEIFLLASMGFFAAYWAFFRSTRYAYGEYKHIHLTLWLAVVIIACFAAAGLPSKDTKKAENKEKGDNAPGTALLLRIRAIYTVAAPKAITAALAVLTVINVCSFANNSKSVYRFDSTMEEFNAAVKEHVPEGETLGILNNLYFDGHSMVYALRSSDRALSLLTSDCYFAYYVPVRTEYPRYIATPVNDVGAYGDVLSSEDYTVVWKNSSYCILKNENDVGVFTHSGFSGLERMPDGTLCRSVGKASEILLVNHLNENVTATVGFDTKGLNGSEGKTFSVFVGEALIGNGVIGEAFRSAPITLQSTSNTVIRIVFDGETDGEMKVTALDVNIITE